MLRFTHGLVHAAAFLLSFPSLALSVFQRCNLSPEEEVEGHGGHGHRRRRMRWRQHRLPPGQGWHEGRGAAGEVRADGWIHLARCTSRQSLRFFPPQSTEVKAGNGEMHLYVGDPLCLCLGVCPSPRVQINDWVNLTVLLSCFPYINPDRGGVFVFVFAHKHVIRLLVSHKFFVLSVEHLVSTGLEMNW